MVIDACGRRRRGTWQGGPTGGLAAWPRGLGVRLEGDVLGGHAGTTS
jgi:hypothetical protein